jgi:5-methylcytosine-specific restriction endonuclease McrA
MAVDQLNLILRLDVTGQPVRWVPWQHAVVLASKSMIAWSAGQNTFTFYGGRNRVSGKQSSIEVSSIIAVRGYSKKHPIENLIPPLSNREMFRRDSHLCMYCGNSFPDHHLTRDHVLPLSLGGTDSWQNVVTACKPCNNAKSARTPEMAQMYLVAVPYIPNRAEYLVLSNRRILADQMAFLRKRFRRKSRMMQQFVTPDSQPEI